MPDPKDPTPVRVEKRGGKFAVVDSAGKLLAGQELLDDSAKAKGVAARVNATWARAKSDRRSKGAPELTEAEGIMYRLKPTASAAVGNRDTTNPNWAHPLHAELQAKRAKSMSVQEGLLEAWSPASRVAAALARHEHSGGEFGGAKAGVQLKPGEHFLHHPYSGSPTHYIAKSVTPGRNNEVHVHAVAADGSHEKHLRFTPASAHPNQVSWQRKNMVHVHESADLREDWSPQARAAAIAARRSRGHSGPAAGLAVQRKLQPHNELGGIGPNRLSTYNPDHGAAKSNQTHVANIARHLDKGPGRVDLPSGASVRRGPNHYVVRSKSGQELTVKHDDELTARVKASGLALRAHQNGGEFPKGLSGLKGGGRRHHLFHAMLDDLVDAARLEA